MKKYALLVLLFPVLAWSQVSVIQSPVPKFRSFTPSGVPNVGGCVYTFASGTNTPLATYTDFTGSTPNSNPVVLDANGEAQIWVSNNVYRFQVWTFGSGTLGNNCGGGTQLYQVDGLQANNSSTNWAQPGQIGATTPNTGAFTTLTATTGIVNGTLTTATLNNQCVVDGVNHTSILSCYNALPSAGGLIYLPAGTYTQALNTLIFSKNIHLTCEDPVTTQIVFTGTVGDGILINYDSSGTGVGSMNDIGSMVENCQLIGPGGQAGGVNNAGLGMQLGDATHASVGFRLYNTQFHGFSVGFAWGNPNSWSFDGDKDSFIGNNQDMLYSFTSGTGCAICRWHHTAFQGSQNANGIQLAGTLGGHFVFDNCFFGDDPITISNSAGWIINFISDDFENTINTTNKYVTIAGGYVAMVGLQQFQQVKASGSIPTAFVSISGGELKLEAMYANSALTMTAAVAISGSANLDLTVVRLVGVTNNTSGTTTGALQVQTQGSNFFAHFIPTTQFWKEVSAQTGQAGQDMLYADSANHAMFLSNNGGTALQVAQFLGGGAISIGGSLINAGTCDTDKTQASANVTTNSRIAWAANSGPPAGWINLTITPFVTAGNVNFRVCNPSASNFTPTAMTVNWFAF